MKSKWLLTTLSILFIQCCIAQDNDLQVMGTGTGLHLMHSVQAKETWYSIGRLYNTNPKELAPYNSLSLDKALAIGQSLKIPLTTANFSQDGKKQADEVFVPLYHTIQEKEWMYRISVNYNKVPIENLEKWNGINKDQAKAGLNLVVGYLKVKSSHSALASKGSNKITTVVAQPVAINSQQEGKAQEGKKQGINEEKKTAEPVVDKPQPVVKNDPPKEEIKQVVNTSHLSLDNKGGYFKMQYEENGKAMNGNAGIFKSTSGWNDGKYYALINNVAVGTIVKVSNPVTGKTVYAKVLGNLPDMKESIGLTARISDAAATELEVTGSKFGVELKY